MPSTLPFLQKLSECASVLHIGPIQGHLQKSRPTPTPAAGQARSMGPQGGATCVADAPRPVGCRERPRAATPCRNTTAALAKPAKNPPIVDQKRDGTLRLERVLLLNRILRTNSAKRDQPLLHRLQ